jgi:hypothetical protein
MRERKAFKLRIRELGDNGLFEGYASTFGNVDSYGDIVERGAFARTIDQNDGRFPILWQHRSDEPIGVSVEMSEDLHGLAVTGQLNLETQRGREAHSLLRQGAIKGLSIGFETVKQTLLGGVRHLVEIRLWEFSVVTFPANDLATVTAVKTGELDELEVALAAHRLAHTSQKEGRVLSDANRRLVESAIEALTALLAAADKGGNGPAAAREDPAYATLRGLFTNCRP